MDDLIIIPRDVFLEYGIMYEPSPKTSIINEILALDCFNESSKNFVAHVSKKTTYTHAPKQHFSKPQVRKILSYHDKIMREITGSMNKLNASNYESILKNIIKIVDIDNVDMICKIILEKSIMHSIYMSSFITLCTNIHSMHPDNVMTVIDNYVNDFISSCKISLDHMIKLDKENYDDFCLFVKKKNNILNQTKLLCALIKQFNLFENCYDGLWDMIMIFIDTDLETVVFEIITTFTQHCGIKSKSFIRELSKVDIDGLKFTKSKFIYKDLINDHCVNKKHTQY